MDYVFYALLFICLCRGWLKGFLYSVLSFAVLLLLAVILVKTTNVGQEIFQFVASGNLSKLFCKNVLEKIINLIL